MTDDTPRLAQCPDLTRAVRAIIEANNDFRAGMPAEWEGDPLQDAINEAAKLLLPSAALGNSVEPVRDASCESGVVQPPPFGEGGLAGRMARHAKQFAEHSGTVELTVTPKEIREIADALAALPGNAGATPFSDHPAIRALCTADGNAGGVEAILAADKEPPEASFDNVEDMLAYLNAPSPAPDAVQAFQERIVAMMQAGCTGFHFSVGNAWHSADIEQKCKWALEIWDAESKPLDFKDSRRAALPNDGRRGTSVPQTEKWEVGKNGWDASDEATREDI
jgi:hypothetical protein